MNTKHTHQSGFTIVELLIVIVVIGILAAITVVAYNGIQQRANDMTRIDGIAKIRKALELYKIDNGRYPNATNSNTSHLDGTYPGGGWEVSEINSATWMNQLAKYMPSGIPKDPTNAAPYYYYYYFYTNNASLCGATTPNCYKLGIAKLDATNALDLEGVDKSGTDTWRHTSATRAVWSERY